MVSLRWIRIFHWLNLYFALETTKISCLMSLLTWSSGISVPLEVGHAYGGGVNLINGLIVHEPRSPKCNALPMYDQMRRQGCRGRLEESLHSQKLWTKQAERIINREPNNKLVQFERLRHPGPHFWSTTCYLLQKLAPPMLVCGLEVDIPLPLSV
ncbi:uncharacterized protein EI90DRAFT_3047190 [Cantharellus anzutake]|uniref:uncharacterized protein n=1 Tax=Cantharellus anzutake TaxID=1750568 RepID=UPI0019062586|nr:uncharacterized protein EI90DRAFT_3047190 [Cantharellus anzutake]KAF8335809.1 hypothetical protein EI90DRAFT_3047190 [Cantharellus anzutake]